ncbi:hypothetical protein ACSFCW_07690 [Yokenella regensburgei]|uniref:hypothetical protein n=1 Tax=Yokenella regensburgei TaxID=158877 RepID=UPI003ED89CFF
MEFNRKELQQIADTDHVQCGDAAAMARMLLAAMQQEPVSIDERVSFNAWNNEDNLPVAGVGAKNAAWLAWQARAKLSIPPPAPVVPDDVIARIEHEANHVTAWHHMDEHSCKVNRRDLLTLVNACRAGFFFAWRKP